MSVKLTPLSQFFSSPLPEDRRVAYHAGRYYTLHQFELSVKHWAEKFQAQAFEHYAVYTDDAYPFAILLFALLHAEKQIWIPGNNCVGTAEQLSAHCQLIGDWYDVETVDYCATVSCHSKSLTVLNPLANNLVIFTSGSEGSPKPIPKCSQQFEREIAMLEQCWGEKLDQSVALATVSHQHIYGLLFRVLWPLSAGRCFYSQLFVDSETVLNVVQHRSAYWIASPAHLKRLNQQTAWEALAKLIVVFSSGGALSEHASQQILHSSQQAVIEIYGSSETGGIAWRQTQKVWTLFSGIRLTGSAENWLLSSPYLPTDSNGQYQLEDRINLLDDEHFILQGRRDRLVKIEEKRLSLTELEQKLTRIAGIADAHTLVINKNRDIVVAVLVLNQQGLAQLTELGRNRLIKSVRQTLAQWFEAVVIPRKWVLVNTLPLTSQGKIAQQLLFCLMNADTGKFPQLLSLELNTDNAQLKIKVPKDLACFPDHFANFPVLPGVVQLAWVTHFSHLLFNITQKFSKMEAVKFVKVIPPDTLLTLALNWNAQSGKLYFTFSSDAGRYSSGRMIFN